MGSVRTIKYLVVDNIVDEVPDAAPEIDVEAATPDDIAAALLRSTRLPPSADIYLQTARPDGSLRWQPLNALSALPEGGLLLAKLVKPKGGAAAGAPRPHPTGSQPVAHPQQQQQQQHHSLIGKLLKKVVGSGSSGTTHTTTHYSNRPTGGPMIMGTAGGLGAAGAGAAGWGRVGGGPTDAEDAAWEQQIAEDAALAQLEEEAMRRDDDDDQGEEVAPQDDDQAFENFEAAAGDYAEQFEADNDQQQEDFADGGGDDNDNDNDNDGGQDDNDFGGGDDDFGGGDSD